jgi:hypothetical protein
VRLFPEIDAEITRLRGRVGLPTMAEFPDQGAGICDDCKKEALARAQYGQFAVCQKCLASRLRVKASLETDSAQKP